MRRDIATPEIVRESAKHWHDLLSPYVQAETKVDYFSFGDFDKNWQQDVINTGQSGNPKMYFGTANLSQVRANYVDAHLLADL